MQKTSSERSGPPERVRSTSPRESHQVRAWNSQLNQYSTSFVFLADARFVSDCRPIGVIVSERTALAVSKCETSDENERYSLTCRRERDFCCRRQARKKCPREKTYAQRQRTAITKHEKWPRSRRFDERAFSRGFRKTGRTRARTWDPLIKRRLTPREINVHSDKCRVKRAMMPQ